MFKTVVKCSMLIDPLNTPETTLPTAVSSLRNLSSSPESVSKRALPTSPTLSNKNAAASMIPYSWHRRKQCSTR